MQRNGGEDRRTTIPLPLELNLARRTDWKSMFRVNRVVADLLFSIR